MYRRTATASVERTADGALIPADPANCDYAQYLGWLAAGNTPTPYEPPAFNLAAAMARARDARKPILDALAGIGFDALATGDTATVAAVRQARQGLLDITRQADVLQAVDDENFDTACMAHYHALAVAAPTVVQNAFRDMLA